MGTLQVRLIDLPVFPSELFTKTFCWKGSVSGLYIYISLAQCPPLSHFSKVDTGVLEGNSCIDHIVISPVARVVLLLIDMLSTFSLAKSNPQF